MTITDCFPCCIYVEKVLAWRNQGVYFYFGCSDVGRGDYFTSLCCVAKWIYLRTYSNHPWCNNLILHRNVASKCLHVKHLKVAVGEKTDTDRYEIMAYEAYGQRCRKITSVLLVICLDGFVVSYIIFVS